MTTTASVIEEIAAERARQITEKGWTPTHDDRHKDGSLAVAAALYASPVKLVTVELLTYGVRWGEPWPWRRWECTGWDERGTGAQTGYWINDGDKRLSHTRRENLVTAAAFIVAEIERLDRAEERTQPQSDEAA